MPIIPGFTDYGVARNNLRVTCMRANHSMATLTTEDMCFTLA